MRLYILMFFFFFFSSRRRHTRFDCDWSSDVCSSDLYWLGVNGKIQVHMGQDGIDNAELYYLGTPKGAVTDHAGVVDHIAFLATEPGGFIRRLKARGIEYQPRSLPEFDLYQIFLKDPNGLTLELNFFGLKDVTDWGGEEYSAMPQVAGTRA